MNVGKLMGADLRGARYSTYTNWPGGFDPVKAGALKVD